MTRIHLPGAARWRCAICSAPTDQRHHVDYRADERWALVPLCDDHHERLHRAWEAIERSVSLAVFSAQFIAGPERAEALARIVPATRIAAQLSFADQATRQGEHWREVEATWAELWEEFADEWDHAA